MTDADDKLARRVMRMEAERDAAYKSLEISSDTIADNDKEIARLKGERDALAAHIAKLPEVLKDLATNEGYCCCGSPMGSHTMGDGHAPVDAGWYAMDQYMQQSPITHLARQAEESRDD